MPKTVRKLPQKPRLEQPKKVAAYARVSTGKDAMLHSLSSQVSYYSKLIQSHKGWLYVGVYSDEALTGTKDSRDGFQRLLADCRAGKVNMILTKSISRFARNTVTLLETVRELKSLEVDIFFEEQNIHTMSSEGELMLHTHRKKACRQAKIRSGGSERVLKTANFSTGGFCSDTALQKTASRLMLKQHRFCVKYSTALLTGRPSALSAEI